MFLSKVDSSIKQKRRVTMAEKDEFVSIVDQTLKALRRNKFDAVFVRNRQEALQSVLSHIPVVVPQLELEIL